jgi:hypothetical protein
MRTVSKTPGSYDTLDVSDPVDILTEDNPRQSVPADVLGDSLRNGPPRSSGGWRRLARTFPDVPNSPKSTLPRAILAYARRTWGTWRREWSGTEMGARLFETYSFPVVQRSMRSSKSLCDLPLRLLHDLTHRNPIQHAHVQGRPSTEGLHMRPH